MAAIENFVLKIKVEGQKAVDDLKKSITDLGTSVNGFGANAGKMTLAISGIVSSIGGLTNIALAAGAAFVGMGMKALSLADDLGDISDATGIAAGALNNFKNSLVLAGGKAEDFSTLAAKLNQNLGDAAVGNEKAQKAFEKLGVYVRDANGHVRDTGDVLREAIAKLAAIEDPATRASLAVDIFGKTANKLDFTKLNAVNDPFKDEQIAQLAKYKDAIDAMANAANDRLITVFGKLAIAIQDADKKAQDAEKKANEAGKTTRQFSPGGPSATMNNAVGSSPTRRMTEDEKSYLSALKERQAYEASMSLSMRGYKTRAQTGSGDYGATPEATLKAIAESEKRTRESAIANNRNLALKGANDIMAIEINAAAEVAKAREEIFSKERLTDAQKGTEFAAKRAEIESKAANDIAKARGQLNAKVYAEEEAQRQKFAEELAAEEKRINDIIAGSKKIVDEITNQNAEMAAKAKFSLDAATMTDQERANAQALFDIEQQRLALLKQIADIKDLPYAERLAREKEVNDLLGKRKEDAVANQEAQKKQTEDFSSGWAKAYKQYVENSNNSFAQAGNMFSSLSRGFEDSMVRFVQTGKLSFKDLFNDLIAQAVRAQSNKLLSSLLGMAGGLFGSLFGGGGGSAGAAVLGLPGYASGGSIPAGQLSVVGEQGPELFLPKTAGTIIPNGMLGSSSNITNVTYSIQAVDASSFRSLVARDPEFLHNVVEQGKRQLPIRSRR